MGAEMDGVGSLNNELKRLEQEWGKKRAIVYVVGSNEEHAPFVEFGTAPHTITPNGAQVLNFTVNGTDVFAGRVDHPGTDAQPYLRPALDSAERKLPSIARASSSLPELIQRTALVAEAEAKRRAPVDTGDLRASIRTQRVQ